MNIIIIWSCSTSSQNTAASRQRCAIFPTAFSDRQSAGKSPQLEESLGTKLFQRRPFALSPTGTELFEFIRPFFENIDVVAERLCQSSSPQLRIAAPAIVLHDYRRKSCDAFAQLPAFRLYLTGGDSH